MMPQDYLKGIKPVTYPGQGGSSYQSPIFTATPSVKSPIQPVDQNKPLYTKSDYDTALASHPLIAPLIATGNSVESLNYALSSGDLSGISDYTGKPFSIQDQQDALAKATEDNRLYYEAQKAKETADTESVLKQKQLDYQNYLATSATNFQTDKTALDQTAANQGVLFSGGRAQKEQALQSKYAQDQAYKQQTMGASIGDVARDYQYKYGNQNAGGLSQYYNLGGNTYNPNVATGGVGSSGLSNIYNPSQYNFQGTTINEAKAEAQKRAAGYLWNKGNKLVSGGYKNQY